MRVSLPSLGPVSGHQIRTSGSTVIIASTLGKDICAALTNNTGNLFLCDEWVTECSRLVFENGGKPIQTIREIRNKLNISLRLAKIAYDVVSWRNIDSCEPLEFTVEPETFLPMEQVESSRRAILELGRTYGVPTYVKVEITSLGNDNPVLEGLFSWAQNDEIPWLFQGSPHFRILSCSDSTCCSMSVGDHVTIYDEELPGTQRTYLCDHGGKWTRI